MNKFPLKLTSKSERSGVSYTDVFENKSGSSSDHDPGTKEKHNERGAVNRLKYLRKHSSHRSMNGRVTTPPNIIDGNYHISFNSAVNIYDYLFQNDFGRITRNETNSVLTALVSLLNK